MVRNPIVGVYITIIRIPIKGGMTITNIATFDHGTYRVVNVILYRVEAFLGRVHDSQVELQQYVFLFPKMATPRKFNSSPLKSGWLERDFPLGKVIFRGKGLNFGGVVVCVKVSIFFFIPPETKKIFGVVQHLTSPKL